MRSLKRAIGRILSVVAVVVRRTCRVRIDADPRASLRAAGKAYVFAILHSHQLAALLANDEPRLAAMISRSPDGELLRPSLTRFGVEPVLGSTRSAARDKGGPRALDTLSLRATRGVPILLAVDGPRGPRGRVHRGAADLAKRTGLPIVPVVIVPSRRWLLRSTWDRFQIPQPFSTIRVFFGEPVYARADETARSLCDRVHTALMELERGHDPSEWQQIHDRT